MRQILAKAIAKAFGAKYAECPKYWDEKAYRVTGAQNAVQVHECMVNFAWMARLPMTNEDRDRADRIWLLLCDLRNKESVPA